MKIGIANTISSLSQIPVSVIHVYINFIDLSISEEQLKSKITEIEKV